MNTKMPWFRSYSEVLSDRKIVRVCRITKLPKGTVIGTWHILLALANDSPERGRLLLTKEIPYTPEDISIESEYSIEDINILLDAFRQLNMINGSDVIEISNWNKRQFKSDDSTERVRKHRERQKETLQDKPDETLQKRSETVIDTESDTEEDKETNKDKPKNPPPSKNKRKSKPRPTPLTVDELLECVPLPDVFAHNLEFVSTWTNFLEYRIEINNPLKKLGAQTTLNKLAKHKVETAIIAMQDTISSGKWITVYPKDEEHNTSRGSPRKSRAEQNKDATEKAIHDMKDYLMEDD